MLRGLTFLLAVLLAQITVSIAIAPGTICPERCADDGPDGRCPPVCLSCVSTAHAAFPTQAAAFVAPTVRPEMASPIATPIPRGPAPGDIFHVPKPSLA